MNTKIEDFKALIRPVQQQSNNCDESQAALRQCASYDDIHSFFLRYIHDISEDVPQQTATALAACWDEYGDLLRDAGVHYNEDTSGWQLCFVGDTDKEIHIRNFARCYILGKATVVAHNRA